MKKYNQFEIFRFIGAFSVLIFHTAKDTEFYYKIPHIFQNGPLWVYFFFVLSGFMLSYTYQNKELNIKSFYVTRFYKFYPLYIFSLILLLRISGKMIYNIFLIQSLILGKALNYNSSAWYLSVLAVFIIIFPFLLNFQKKYPKIFLYCVVVLNIYTYYIYYSFIRYSDIDFIHHAINYFPLMHISSFTLGMELYNLIKNFKKKNIYSIFATLYFIILIFFNQYNRVVPYFSTLTSLSFAILIALLYLDNGFMSKILGNKFFIYLGSLSFSIYILHIPTYTLFEKYISKINSLNSFVLFFILVFILSNFTRYFIENKYYKYLISKYNNI